MLSLEARVVARLDDYLMYIGQALKDKRKRASFATYAMGILGDGERKSVEPIAARACGDPAQARAVHERLLHFVTDAVWSDRAVRRLALQHAIGAMEERAHQAVDVWLLDDTGFLKQGDKSPGVQRQYTGSAGKVTNCQIAVVLAAATRHEAIPIDAELYLPEAWTTDPERRKHARIPESVTFQTKHDLALSMIERACLDKIPGQVLLADSGYGDSFAFREAVSMYGLDYAVGIKGQTNVVLAERDDRAPEIATAGEIAQSLSDDDYETYQWREVVSTRTLAAQFAFRRVRVAHDNGEPLEERQPIWLIIERELGSGKTKLHLTTLPRRMSKSDIVQIIKERWRVEQMFQELKGELGFDHFEGRTFPGWHHHVSVVFCCYAFVVSERARLFPPPARTPSCNANERETRASLRRLVFLDTTYAGARPRSMATALSPVP